jgi:predicted amidohydrolase
VLCMQEICTQPYFCPSQDARWYAAAEAIPDGATTKLMQEYARKHGMVIVLPIYEEEIPGVYYNAAAVIDADGGYLGKYRKTHIPQVAGFYEKFFFKPGNSGYPVFHTTYCKLGVYICYDRHFPEGWRALALNGAEYIVNPSATVAGLSQYLWKLEQPAAAVANGVFVGAINRPGTEEPWRIGRFYGSSYVCNPRGELLCARDLWRPDRALTGRGHPPAQRCHCRNTSSPAPRGNGSGRSHGVSIMMWWPSTDERSKASSTSSTCSARSPFARWGRPWCKAAAMSSRPMTR